MVLIIVSSPFLDRDPLSATKNLMPHNREPCIFEFRRSSKGVESHIALAGGGDFPISGPASEKPRENWGYPA
jgi:hypothetical protein